MFARLIALCIIIPFLELAILIEIGARIGTLNTIALVVLAGIAGASLLKFQGLQVLMQIRLQLNRGILPTEELFDGLLILIAGVLLITPGVLSDIAGICILVPQLRVHIKEFFKKWVRRKMENDDSYFTFKTSL